MFGLQAKKKIELTMPATKGGIPPIGGTGPGAAAAGVDDEAPELSTSTNPYKEEG